MIEYAIVSPEAEAAGRAWYEAILVRESDRVALARHRATLRELELTAERSDAACEQARKRYDLSQQTSTLR